MNELTEPNQPKSNLLTERSAQSTRMDNLTDAVFGIAITLLIFNLANPNSYADLIQFTKTLPAFLISIAFLILIWREHTDFSKIYGLDDTWIVIMNTLFLALVIFFVYPLRFLSLFLTKIFFQINLDISISGADVSDLMIYFSFIVFAIYFLVFMFYLRAEKIKAQLKLTDYEQFYTKAHMYRLSILFLVPLVSIILVVLLKPFSIIWAPMAGGIIYFLYTPAMIMWSLRFDKKSKSYYHV